MAKHDKRNDEKHIMNVSLIAIFLIAVLAIFGMVALVTGGSPTGSSPVLADTAAQPWIALEHIDVNDRVVTFLQSDGLLIDVELDEDGFGTLSIAGDAHEIFAPVYSFESRAHDFISIDADGDGIFDWTAYRGEQLRLW